MLFDALIGENLTFAPAISSVFDVMACLKVIRQAPHPLRFFWDTIEGERKQTSKNWPTLIEVNLSRPLGNCYSC